MNRSELDSISEASENRTSVLSGHRCQLLFKPATAEDCDVFLEDEVPEDGLPEDESSEDELCKDDLSGDEGVEGAHLSIIREHRALALSNFRTQGHQWKQTYLPGEFYCRNCLGVLEGWWAESNAESASETEDLTASMPGAFVE